MAWLAVHSGSQPRKHGFWELEMSRHEIPQVRCLKSEGGGREEKKDKEGREGDRIEEGRREWEKGRVREKKLKIWHVPVIVASSCLCHQNWVKDGKGEREEEGV